MPTMAGLRVVIVGINYSPEHAGIAPYTSQAAEYLAQQGAIVQVLTGIPHYPSWTVPNEYSSRFLMSDEFINGVAVRRLRHFVPRCQTALRRGLYEISFGLRIACQRVGKPDVVIGVSPSLMGCVAAMTLADRAGVPFIAWVQDLMGNAAGQSGMRGGHRVQRFTMILERTAMRRASQVLTINAGFAEYFVRNRIHREAITIVRNWSHIPAPSQSREVMRARLGWRNDEFVALHTGNMGLKQALHNLVDVARIADCEGFPVRFVLMGDGSQRPGLIKYSEGIDALQILGPAHNDDYPNVLAAADVGIVNERAGATEMSLPSKLTSYFQAALPVVAAVPTGGPAAREVKRSGAGVLVEPEQPRALIQALTTLMKDPRQLTALRVAAAAYAADELAAASSLRLFAQSIEAVVQQARKHRADRG